MTIIEKNLYRALCYGQDIKNIKEFEWREGYLGWIEVMGYPILSKKSEEEDRNTYFIGCRKPHSSADWGLSYPQAKFYIPDEMRHTITRYTGYRDLHGIKIFNGDIIQNINSLEVYYYINNNKVYDESEAWYFLHEYVKAHTNEFDSYIVVGNIFEWKKLNEEALEWFKTTNYYKQNIRGD